MKKLVLLRTLSGDFSIRRHTKLPLYPVTPLVHPWQQLPRDSERTFPAPPGDAIRNKTWNLLHTKHMLYSLSYGVCVKMFRCLLYITWSSFGGRAAYTDPRPTKTRNTGSYFVPS